jgi:hypothetical protein
VLREDSGRIDLADTKYSALTITTAAGGDIFAVAKLGTSFALTISSAVASQTTSQTQDQGILFTNVNVVSTDASLQYHYSTQVQHLAGSSSQIWMNGVSVTPASTATSTLSFYAKSISGRMMHKIIGPAGIEYALQPSMFQQNITYWKPTTSVTGKWENTDGYTVGTYSTALPQPNNLYMNTKRGVYSNSSASTNLQAGQAGNELLFTRASTAGMGGFFFFARAGTEQFQSTTRYMVGLTARATADICTSDTNTYLNTLAFVIQNATSTWKFYHASTGTGTSETISGQNQLMAASTNGAGFDFYIYCPSNTNTVYYRMDDINAASTIISSSVTNHLPNSTSYLRPVAMCGNAGASTGAAKIGVITMYVETDL